MVSSAIVGSLCAFMPIRMASSLSIEHRAWGADRARIQHLLDFGHRGWMPFCRLQSAQIYMAAMEIYWRASLGKEVEDAAEGMGRCSFCKTDEGGWRPLESKINTCKTSKMNSSACSIKQKSISRGQ